MQGMGLLLLRLVLGFIFVFHGLPKLVPIWGASPYETAALFDAAGVVPAYPIAVGAGLVEMLGGILLIVGGYTPWTSFLLLTTAGVLAWRVHLPPDYLTTWTITDGLGRGDEHALLLIGALICLMLAGPGALSLDRHRARLAAARKLRREVQRAGTD